MSTTARTLALVAALTLALTGCSAKKDKTTPPEDPAAAAALLVEAAAATAEIKTTHFVLDVDGTITGLSVKHAEGDLTREGSAKGTASINQFGSTFEAEFVMVDKKLYLKGPTGGFQQLDAAAAAFVYDPSAILDPQRGVAKILSAARNPKMLGIEKVEGSDANKIGLDTDPATLAALIPGAPQGVTVVVWVDSTTKKLVKGAFTVPGASGAGGTVTVTLTKHDAPVTISAP